MPSQLVPEPFLLVGLIAGIRRVPHFVIELAVLTVLVVTLTISLSLLRKSGQVSAKRT